MSKSNPPEGTKKRGSYWAVLLFGPALLWAGCATAPEPQVTTDDIETIQQRVEDVERTNGRLMVRLEEMERQSSLTQDRVESNRIALQRRGYLGNRNRNYAQAPSDDESRRGDQRPGPAPESHYRQQRDSNYRADPSVRQRMERRGMSRIPLSDQQSGRVDRRQDEYQYDDRDVERRQPSRQRQDESRDEDRQELVITNAELEARFGPSRSSANSQRPRQESSSSENSGSSGGSAHEPVTSERLPTTAELAGSSPQQAPSEPSDNDLSGASEEELLDLYQDSLAQYRAGDYGQALQGFTDFLHAGPRDDYVDNALYWIGECHYGLGDYDRSVDYFTRILDERPSGNKVPDAMLKMSLAHDRRGEPEKAVDLLQELTDRYPNSNSGRLGKERLEEYGAQ